MAGHRSAGVGAKVSTTELEDLSVTTPKLALLSVTASILAALAVTSAKIQTSAVTSVKLLNGAVTAEKIGTNAVTNVKINDVNGTKISSGLIAAARLGSGASSSKFLRGDQTYQTVGGLPSGTVLATGNAFGSMPSGYLLCDGAAVSRTTYADLFAAISTRFGVGDGSTTFNLPDLRGKFPRGAPASTEAGSTGGADTVAISTSELASHGHSVTNPTHTHQAGSTNAASNLVSNATATEWEQGAQSEAKYGLGTAQSTSISNTGSGSAHENKPKYQEVQYMIKT